MTAAPNSATGIRWNLNDLYKAIDDPQIDADLAACQAAASTFADKYRGFWGTVTSGAAVRDAIAELERISEILGKLGSYSGLRTAVETLDPACRQLEDRIDTASVEIQNLLTFFELEWQQLDDARAAELAALPEAAAYQYYLTSSRRYRPHTLSEPEERILNQKSLTARSAWTNLFEEYVASLKYELDYHGEKRTLTQSAILALVYEPDRGLRKAAQECFYTEIAKHDVVFRNIYNGITLDHSLDDQIRKYPGAMASRHLANSVAPEVVDNMLGAVEKNYGIAHAYFRLKARLLKLDKLATYDQYAPVAVNMPSCRYEHGRDSVLAAFRRFSPEMEQIAKRFFDENWIDAEVRPGKRSGAFSASTVPSVHPYILLNWTEKLRDVSTMAHELGHGIHQYLSRKQTYFNFHHPLTIAETASVFAEFLTFDYVMETEANPEVRLGLLCGKLEDAFATVFRQSVLTRFEQSAHAGRRKSKLSTDQICDFWWQANHAYYGDAVDMLDLYRWGWAYIPHFIHTPFYCYAYVFGELLVLSLYKMYHEEGPSFVPRYLELLQAGSSASPADLVKRVGADINDPGFWQKGLDVLASMVTQAEKLAKECRG